MARLRAFATFMLEEGYLWDWITAGAGILINQLVPARAVDPLRRAYNPADPTISYPVRSSSVPTSALYVLVFVLPAVVFAVTAALKRYAGLVDWHHAALSIAEGFALATGFKRWINLVGVLRPNWNSVLALNDADETADARLSYPSGHAAYICMACAVMALYLAGKTDLLHRPSQPLFLKAVLCGSPLALAAFVAVSRIADYKHAPADVNAGSFIGLACGAVAYFLNYPSLWDPASSLPKRRGAAAEAAAAKRAERYRAGAAELPTVGGRGGADPYGSGVSL